MTRVHQRGLPPSLPARILALLTLLAVMLVPSLHLVQAHGHLDLAATHGSAAGFSDGSLSQGDTLCALCNTFGAALHVGVPVLFRFAAVESALPRPATVRIGTNCPLDRFCRPPPVAALAAIAGAA